MLPSVAGRWLNFLWPIVLVGLLALALALPSASARAQETGERPGALLAVNVSNDQRDGVWAVGKSDASLEFLSGAGPGNVRGAAFHSNGTMYVAGHHGHLYAVDPSNARATYIGVLGGVDGAAIVMDGLAFNSSDVLYGVASDRAMYVIDPETAVATRVGSLGVSNIQDISFDSSDNLYGLTYYVRAASGVLTHYSYLYKISNTGQTTRIGARTSSSAGYRALAIHPTTNIAYMTRRSASGNDHLYTISLDVGGGGIYVGNVGAGFATNAMDFNSSGVLYAVDTVRHTLDTIDHSDGSTTNIGTVGHSNGPLGMAINNSGIIYFTAALSSGDVGLWTLNPSTKELRLIADTGSDPHEIAFHGNGTLYGIDTDGSDNLVTIDTSTGALTDVGTGTVTTGISDIAIRSDDVGFALVSDDLYRLSLSDSTVGQVGDTDRIDARGLAFDADDVLYTTDLYRATDGLWTVDPSTAASTLVAEFGQEMRITLMDWLEVAAPSRVSGVTLDAGTAGQINVTWNRTTNATGYKVQWGTTQGEVDATNQLLIEGGRTTTATIEPVVFGTTYYVRVIATRSYAEDGAASSESTAGTAAGVPEHIFAQAPPDFLVQRNEGVGSIRSFTASWTAVATAASYQMRVVYGGTTIYYDSEGNTFLQVTLPDETNYAEASLRGYRTEVNSDGESLINYTLETVAHPLRWVEFAEITTDIPYTPGPAAEPVASYADELLRSVGLEPYETNVDGVVVIVDPVDERAPMLSMAICGGLAVGLGALLMVTTGNIGIAAVGVVAIWSGVGPWWFTINPAMAYGPLVALFLPVAMLMFKKLG